MHFQLKMRVVLQNDMQKELRTLAISLAAPKSALSRHVAGLPVTLHYLATSLANIDAAFSLLTSLLNIKFALSPHIAGQQ